MIRIQWEMPDTASHLQGMIGKQTIESIPIKITVSGDDQPMEIQTIESIHGPPMQVPYHHNRYPNSSGVYELINRLVDVLDVNVHSIILQLLKNRSDNKDLLNLSKHLERIVAERL